MGPLPSPDEIPVRDQRHRDERQRRADLSGDRVPAQPGRWRRHHRRLRLSRQGAAGAARQVHLRRHFDRQGLVRRLPGNARGRRWQCGDAGEAARRQPALGGAAKRSGCRRRASGLSVGVSDRPRLLQVARRPGSGFARNRDGIGQRPRRHSLRDRFRRRALSPEQGRRHDPIGRGSSASSCRADAEDPSARSDAVDGRLRLLLVGRQAGAAHRLRRHHRRRHAADQQSDRPRAAPVSPTTRSRRRSKRSSPRSPAIAADPAATS